MLSRLIYLAAPYSHKNKDVMIERFLRINKVAAKLMAQGNYIFSPISHTHPIAEAGELPRGWEFWKGYDEEMISHCSSLYVLTLEGWQESTGVNAEVELAAVWEIPISFIDENLSIVTLDEIIDAPEFQELLQDP
jgi:hypothetical protein